MRRRWSLVLAVVLGVVLLAACEPSPDPEDEPGSVQLTFGVFGTDDEVAAYQTMVDAYNAEAVSQVELVSWPTSDAMATDLGSGAEPPDLYMVARRDLAGVVEAERNTPLFDLLEARDLSYGDDFSQPAIEAFSADDDLQCMPYSISPMVIYYNTDLIDFEEMRERDLPAPDDELEGWTFEEFAAAATFASRSRGQTRGVSISPTLRSLAPFVYSGGGALFNDTADPTSLALSEGGSVDALTTTLTVLRDVQSTLDEDQLAEATPQEWFERGELGMIEGFRDLTPELRQVEGLDFDVMPMPQLGDPATVGDVTGLCIAPGDRVQQAADFLVHAISDEGVEPVSEAGYVVPTNLTVARSEAFLQPDQQPANAGVFNASVDDMVFLPLIDDPDALSAAVAPLLDEMVYDVGQIDVAELTAEIDAASRSVLDPDYEPPSESPSD